MLSIAIANQKGGVGKTTVTLGLAEAGLYRGSRVLVVDCDPQANATAGLGLSITNQNNLSTILENEIILTKDNYNDYIQQSIWCDKNNPSLSIDVLSSHPRLSQVESHIANDPIGSYDRLSNALKALEEIYDLVLIDCPPSVGLLTINALFAADRVIVVSAPSAWSLDGVESFLKNVERIALRRSGKPRLAGIVVNNVGRTRDSRYWENEIRNRFDCEVKSISSRAAIAEASAMSCSLRDLGSRIGANDAINHFNDVYMALIGLEGFATDGYSDKDGIDKEVTTDVRV